MLKKLIITTLAYLLTLGSALSAPPGVGAIVEGRLQQRLDHLSRTPELVAEPVTIIIEADALAVGDVLPHAGTLRYRYGRLHEVSIPSGKLAGLLAHLPDNVLARLPYHHEPVAVTSQGVVKTGAADMQSMGTSGAGVKMGIIDLGFASLSSAQASGDLPGNLTITDYTGTGATSGTENHGTNVAQIAYDMAPGATLYLAKISTETQLSQALNDMATAGVKVINHSVAWFGAAFYDGTGPICNIANSADSKGILWMNAMGNARQQHYLGTFTDANADLRHEFAVNQNYNTISLTAGTAISLILNWDAYPTTTVDYDLYLYNGNPNSGGTLVASSVNKQSGKGASYYPYPYETINYTPATTATHYIVVKKVTSSQPNLPLTLFATGSSLGTQTAAKSILQPADCANVVGVGAVNLSDVAEGFSSEGPTTDGRAKPEISAPDGVKTSLSSAFYGTSASSPHATGAAALLLAKNLAMTPAQLRAALVSAVKDVGAAGYDYRTGSGRISLDADGDGLNHDEELTSSTSPTNDDTDGDGLTDFEEVRVYNTSPINVDTDNDGLTDWQEIRVYNTQASNPDTDADGLADGLEVNTWHTSAINADTDGDELKDGEEVNIYGTSPTATDTDGDGLTDWQEAKVYLTNPNFSNKGDLAPRGNPNVTVDVADLLILTRLVAELDVPTAQEIILADMNNDGALDVRDILLLRRNLGY